MENITMVVALAEAERRRRVDERAALRIEAAAEQRPTARSAIARGAAKDAEVEPGTRGATLKKEPRASIWSRSAPGR